MIYTSYFGKLKKIPDSIILIAICAKCPEWYMGLTYKKLAPSYQILMDWKKTKNEEQYIRDFNEQILGKLDVKQVCQELQDLAQNQKIVLLCYERAEDFCHRHLVAKWMRDNGIDCGEWKEL
ncbi:MAG: hypothetical protein DBX58_06265 [Clostridiales bacterium]|nr:MAG: hypothetical protein DBX58_06265 [Clostridiales bacterium]